MRVKGYFPYGDRQVILLEGKETCITFKSAVRKDTPEHQESTHTEQEINEKVAQGVGECFQAFKNNH